MILCWVHVYLQLFIFFLDWSLDHYVVSFFVSWNSLCFKVYFACISIATPAFFGFPFALNTFFHLRIFSLYVSLDLKWVSCRQHIHRSYICFHSAPLCLLIEAFSLFTFKVIINGYYLLPFCYFFCSSFFFSFELMTLFSVMFGFLSLFLCVYLL